MLIGGMRALLLQALEPAAMAAVDQHGKFREDPWGRLERTTHFVMATIYGDTAAAEAACERVRKVHARIHGVDPVTGRHYSGSDPDLLLWIHAVEVESFVLVYRKYAGRLSEEDADRYVVEMGRVRRDGGTAPTWLRDQWAKCVSTCGRYAPRCKPHRPRSTVCGSSCFPPCSFNTVRCG